MLLGISYGVLAALALALVVGALVQSTVGLGVGLVAAPVTTLLAPELMPGFMLWLTLLLPVGTLLEGRREVDVRGLAWALPARVPGTVLGAVLVATLDQSALGLAIGVVVLLAVATTASSLRVPLRPATLVGAGLLSGVTGTVSSIGGPPMALLYQRQPVATIRQTLAVYFFVGAALSLTALGVGGGLDWRQAALAALLSPALVVGLLLAPRLRRRLAPDQVRLAVLVVCAVSAVALVVRSLTAA